MQLEGKTALITGGGKAIALAFAGEGANVSIAARTEPELKATALQVEQWDGKVWPS
ncbi:MAG: hypothetical protein HY787_03330 [Deltaproteobacteria bacterium]|nr:hypothetical protein [Deltaproteobacteria bacterium]